MNEERRSVPQIAVDDIKEDIREMKGDMKGIYKILNGNGNVGLRVIIDRNSSFRKVGSKVLWLFTGGFITLLFFMLRSGLIKGVITGQ